MGCVADAIIVQPNGQCRNSARRRGGSGSKEAGRIGNAGGSGVGPGCNIGEMLHAPAADPLRKDIALAGADRSDICVSATEVLISTRTNSMQFILACWLLHAADVRGILRRPRNPPHAYRHVIQRIALLCLSFHCRLTPMKMHHVRGDKFCDPLHQRSSLLHLHGNKAKSNM